MDSIMGYVAMISASAIFWMLYNHKKTLAQIETSWSRRPPNPSPPLQKKRKIEVIPEIPYSGHESIFGRLEKATKPREGTIIVVPTSTERGISTSDFDEVIETRTRTFEEKVDPDRTRKSIMSSKLIESKKKAGVFIVNSFKSKREKFYEKIRETSTASSSKTLYSTLAPVLTNKIGVVESKTEVKIVGKDEGAKNLEKKDRLEVKEDIRTEKNILNLGYKPVNVANSGDLSKTQRFEIPSSVKTVEKEKEVKSVGKDLGSSGFVGEPQKIALFDQGKTPALSLGTAGTSSLFSGSATKVFEPSKTPAEPSIKKDEAEKSGLFQGSSLFSQGFKPSDSNLFSSKPINILPGSLSDKKEASSLFPSSAGGQSSLFAPTKELPEKSQEKSEKKVEAPTENKVPPVEQKPSLFGSTFSSKLGDFTGSGFSSSFGTKAEAPGFVNLGGNLFGAGVKSNPTISAFGAFDPKKPTESMFVPKEGDNKDATLSAFPSVFANKDSLPKDAEKITPALNQDPLKPSLFQPMENKNLAPTPSDIPKAAMSFLDPVKPPTTTTPSLFNLNSTSLSGTSLFGAAKTPISTEPSKSLFSNPPLSQDLLKPASTQPSSLFSQSTTPSLFNTAFSTTSPIASQAQPFGTLQFPQATTPQGNSNSPFTNHILTSFSNPATQSLFKTNNS